MAVDPVKAVLRNIAANVRYWRQRGGYSQQVLAERAELDLSYVQRVEGATANPTVRTLVQLAQALDVLPEALFAVAPFAPAGRGRPAKRRSPTGA